MNTMLCVTKNYDFENSKSFEIFCKKNLNLICFFNFLATSDIHIITKSKLIFII